MSDPADPHLTLTISPHIHRLYPPLTPQAASPPNHSTLSVFDSTLGLAHPPPLSDPATPAERLRLWRHDALMQHHYVTAAYIGDKVLALTNDPNDAFWLAQVHYATGAYGRARALLSGAAFDNSVSCRYLAALCLVRLEQWDEALDVVGEVNPFRSPDRPKNRDGGIALEALMCHVRGLIYAAQNNYARAKECYTEAVLVDAKCYEAFDQLISNHMLLPSEEWSLLASLDFGDADDNRELVRLLYTTRIGRYSHLARREAAEQALAREYLLGENADVLTARARMCLVQGRFQQCKQVCEQVLRLDPYDLEVLPTYVACLYELKGRNLLFLTAHKLAERHPLHPATWLAVGAYYRLIDRAGEARKCYARALQLDPQCAPAWIGLAHSFSSDGEHEQAAATYAAAARLFQGSHLPHLFLGMQYLQQGGLVLAQEHLAASHHLCDSDPQVLNEMAVVYYHRGELLAAETYLEQAIGMARSHQLHESHVVWMSVHTNLGHVYRRQGRFQQLLECFERALRLNAGDAGLKTSVGLVCLHLGDASRAVASLHDALALRPHDAVATDLLNRALDLSSRSVYWDDEE